MEKFSDKLIKESKSITYLCDEYDSRKKNIHDELNSLSDELNSLDGDYSFRMTKMISEVLKRYNNYHELGGYVDFLSVVDDHIELSSLSIVAGGRLLLTDVWKMKLEEMDDYGEVHGTEMLLSNFKTEDLSILLRYILGCDKIVKSFGVNAVIKINQ